MTPIRHIVIVGAGGFGREVACWLDDAPPACGARIRGFLDDTRPAADRLDASYPYPMLGAIAEYVPQPDEGLVVAIGDPRSKLHVARALAERGARFFDVVHPSARVARTSVRGRGLILCPNAVVSADVVLGDFVTVNLFSSVGHDAVVGDGTTLSSHVDVTGGARLGVGVFVGSNASILPGVQVGDFAVVGAGSIVVRRVEAGTTVYAAPARKL